MTVNVRLAALALLLLLGACAFYAPLQPAPDYYVMRHLNTAPGTPDPDLTEEGRRNAELLANWFAAPPPATIFVSTAKRAQQTAAPLAARLGITPRVYDPADTDGLLTEMMKEPWPILIVGHSNTVPEIVARLGGTRPPPLGHDDFGDIWHISGPRRTVTKRRLGGG